VPHSRPKIAPATRVRIAAPGERQPGDRDVDPEERRGRLERVPRHVGVDDRALRLEILEGDVSLQVEDEERGDE
jgi:hypothetical protein